MKCGVQSAEFGRKAGKLLCTVVVMQIMMFCFQSSVIAAEKWQGVDESVVEKYAEEQGREAHPPLINTDQGDLLLFVFLIAGTVGGFVAGYYWRMLMVEKSPAAKSEKKSAD